MSAKKKKKKEGEDSAHPSGWSETQNQSLFEQCQNTPESQEANVEQIKLNDKIRNPVIPTISIS